MTDAFITAVTTLIFNLKRNGQHTFGLKRSTGVLRHQSVQFHTAAGGEIDGKHTVNDYNEHYS